MTNDGAAARAWRTALNDWAIPDEIRNAAVSFPYEMDPALFRPRPEGDGASQSLATRRALEALPAGRNNSVIDVGCGGGAATMAVSSHVDRATGVDQSSAMLAVFAEEAAARAVECTTIVGTWPDVAIDAGTADLVLCHHVAYNVADLGPFVTALHTAARSRVVMELTLTHPQTANAALWRQFWDLDRPSEPSADDALAVIHEIGIEATLEVGSAGALRREASVEARAVTAARMLCLGPDRLPEVENAVRSLAPRSDQRAVIWWDAS